VASPFGTILDMGCPALLAIFWREGGPLDINEYLYLGNQRVARALNFGSSYYYYADYLGTSRASADENGNKCYDADYFPWGGEQYVFTNTCSQNYKFTGKERDPDMGIDDFGARFYKNTMARFYSPDWSATVEPVPYARLNNPQSLNLYTYVLDNPLSFRDADGHELGADTLQEVQKITSDSGNAAQNKKDPPKKQPSKASQYAKGGLKIVGGIAAVAVVATNPEIGVVGALVGGIGGSASFVSGTTQIVGTATNTDVSAGTEAVEAYGSPQGLVVGAATGGNQSLAAVATTTGDVAGLVGKPEGAVGVVDKISTVVGLATGGIQDTYTTIRNFISPPLPPPPPTPGLPPN